MNYLCKFLIKGNLAKIYFNNAVMLSSIFDNATYHWPWTFEPWNLFPISTSILWKRKKYIYSAHGRTMPINIIEVETSLTIFVQQAMPAQGSIFRTVFKTS